MGVLDGKVAVITGSSKGLGLAIAQAYVREGAAVVLSGRSEEALQQNVVELQQQGARASFLVADASDLAQVRALADHAVETFGKIDVWVNNAGYGGVFGPTAAIDPADFERVLRTNILGEYYGSLVALQYFLQQHSGGKLINLMGRGDKGFAPYQAAYGSSKAWVRSFTLTLAKEYKNVKNIGIYAFNPGLVDTDLLRKVEVVEGYGERLKRFGTIIRWWANTPRVPAERAVWLASSATDGKTGLEVRLLGPARLAGGLLKDVRRQVRREPAPDTSVQLVSVVANTMNLD